MKDVEGKVAFITGGSSGIGLGIARAFTDAGMKAVIGFLTPRHLEDAMTVLRNAADRIHAISVDVTDRQGMENAAAETLRVFGKVHVLVNNAGVTGVAPLSSTTYDDWDWIMGVNVDGVFNGLRAFLPHIREHGEGGHVITTSSLAGLAACAGGAAYVTSKFAVVGMMESLRADLPETNIGVSVYCPNGVRSNILYSNRNRPPAMLETGFNQDADVIESVERHRNESDLIMDPLRAGQLVLRGMRDNDLYILSHPESQEIIRNRNEALVSSFPSDWHLTEEQAALAREAWQPNVYRAECDRKQRAAMSSSDAR